VCHFVNVLVGAKDSNSDLNGLFCRQHSTVAPLRLRELVLAALSQKKFSVTISKRTLPEESSRNSAGLRNVFAAC